MNKAPPQPTSLKHTLLQTAGTTRTGYVAIFSLIALVCLALSQLSSWLVNQQIPLGNSVTIIEDALHFTHIRNLGGVFGMAQGQGWLFALFSIVLISALVVYLLRGKQVHLYEYICFGFVAGGGISNILDRLIYGSVVDFIDVRGIPYWHYVFNTADTFIHFGLWPMLFIGLFWHHKRA